MDISLFFTKVIKIMSFYKNIDVIVKMIIQKKFWYGTMYQELFKIVKKFQSFSNKFKDFMERGFNIKRAQLSYRSNGSF